MKRVLLAIALATLVIQTSTAQIAMPGFVSGMLRLPPAGGGNPTPDTTPPVVTITVPTTAPTYDNGAISTISIGGTATDNVNVSSCTGLSDKTGAFAVSSTGGFWSTSQVTLQAGVTNNLSVTCVDPSGNSHNDSIAVAYTQPVGKCVADGGSCIDSLSSTTPAVGDVLIAVGQDLHQETKTGWSTHWVTTYPTAWSFEGSTFEAMGYQQPTGQTSASLSTVKPLFGSRHGRFNNRTVSSTCTGPGIGTSQINIPGPPQDVWVRVYQNFTYGSVGSPYWPQGYLKNFEFYQGGMYAQFMDGTPQGSTPSGFRLFAAAPNVVPSTNQMFTMPTSVGTSFDMDRWYLYEYHAVSGTPASFTWYVDGDLVVSRTWTSQTPWSYLIGPLINGCGPVGTSWDIIADIDGIAWGTQQIGPSSKIEVCNESSYASCTTKIYQPPRYISDTSVSFTFRKASPAASLSSGTGYVYITNNEGQVSAGRAITIP